MQRTGLGTAWVKSSALLKRGRLFNGHQAKQVALSVAAWSQFSPIRTPPNLFLPWLTGYFKRLGPGNCLIEEALDQTHSLTLSHELLAPLPALACVACADTGGAAWHMR